MTVRYGMRKGLLGLVLLAAGGCVINPVPTPDIGSAMNSQGGEQGGSGGGQGTTADNADATAGGGGMATADAVAGPADASTPSADGGAVTDGVSGLDGGADS